LYQEYAEKNADFDVFVVAGMMPLDFLLYDKDIRARRPGAVLLYLSEFDIAKQETPEALAVSPAVPASRLVSIWRGVQTLPRPRDYDWAIASLGAGKLFPEFRYRYVFQGLVEKPAWRVARGLGRKIDESRQRSTERERARWIRESLQADYIDFNMTFLTDFVKKMSVHGIPTVIIEGHYNPIVSDDRTRNLAERTRERLEALAIGMPLVTYLPRSRIRCLERRDYVDLTHVNEQVGYEFAEAVVRTLNAASLDAPDERTSDREVSGNGRVTAKVQCPEPRLTPDRK
jgi:hypothetical protein